MRIIMVSNSPWRTDNSFGNTFNNIFGGMENLEIAIVYCKYGQPSADSIAVRHFQITEKMLLRNRIKGTPSGQEVRIQRKQEHPTDDGEQQFNSFKKHKNLLLYWARGIIWKIGRWKSQELIQFIDDFKPDLLFMPVYYSYYIHDITGFICKHCKIPVIGYTLDDVYSLRQYSLSPFFWIDRLLMHIKIKRVIEGCSKLYVISDVQCKEYGAEFRMPMDILTKCKNFCDEQRPPKHPPNAGVLRLLYAGNVSKGRMDILHRLAQAIDRINANGPVMRLDIYTASTLTENKKAMLNIPGSAELHLPVSYQEVQQLIRDADILVHAEAFLLQESMAVHQSFSTKIVDYIASNRCILAIGAPRCASIQYFINNQCALVATKPEEIETSLRKVLEDRACMEAYADRAWQTGVKLHDKMHTQQMLLRDFNAAVGKE